MLVPQAFHSLVMVSSVSSEALLLNAARIGPLQHDAAHIGLRFIAGMLMSYLNEMAEVFVSRRSLSNDLQAL